MEVQVNGSQLYFHTFDSIEHSCKATLFYSVSFIFAFNSLVCEIFLSIKNLDRNFYINLVQCSHWTNARSSHLELFCRKGILKNFAKFIGKHFCASVSFSIKLQASDQVFSCEFWKIFKNTFFIEHLYWLLLSYLSKCVYDLHVEEYLWPCQTGMTECLFSQESTEFDGTWIESQWS